MDTAMGLAGRWIGEISELSAMGDSTIELVKAFLSQTMDRFRPPYGRVVVDNPRQCIFAGTTNKNAFLRDETGDRRFWPVGWCTLETLKLGELERDRDQLWAEAVHLYNSGRVWWLETPELRALAEQEQSDRFEEDPWEGATAKWIAKHSATEVDVDKLLFTVMGMMPAEATKADRARISAVMRRLKWERAPGEKLWKPRAV
jgi:predicted P-loop ATPase